MKQQLWIGSLLVALLLGQPAQATPWLEVTTTQGIPGGGALLSVVLHTEGEPIVAVQNRIAFDPATVGIPPVTTGGSPDCRVNPEIGKPWTGFSFGPDGCCAGCGDQDCTEIKAIVIDLEGRDLIPDGSVLYTCRLAIGDVAEGAYPLECWDAIGSPPPGADLEMDCIAHDVVVSSHGFCGGDSNSDLRVSISELVTAVNNSLLGCER